MSGRDHGYMLPEVVDPQRIRLCIEIPDDLNHLIAFWGAIEELQHAYNWQNDDDHTALAAAAVWKDVIFNARESWLNGECASEEACQTYAPTSPRITWYPENPYEHDPLPPDGYLFHPWTVADNSTIGSIISLWGLGYQVGDVYTDLTKLPAGDWGEIIDDGYLFFPRFRINDLNGAGTVKLHLLNIPQGGRALIVVDGVLDLFNLQLIELNKDGVSIPPETQVPIVIEVPIETVGDHFIDVVFVPNVNDEAIPFFFGGGLRQIEICGFGLEGCDDVTDPCCPETNDTLRQILNLLKGGATINFNAVNQAGDFVVDCSPEGFSGNPDDTVPEQIQRANALCLAIARWLVACLYVTAGKMNNLSIIPDILALSGEAEAPTFVTEIEYADSLLSRAAFNEMVLDDTAFAVVVCAIRGALDGQDNSFVQFKRALSNLVAATDEETPSAVGNMLFLAWAFAQNRVNYAVFSRATEQAFNDIVNGNTYACPCVGDICDVSTIELIGLEGTIVTRIDDDHWRVQQTNFTDAPPDKRSFKAVVRDNLWRCFNLLEPTSGWAGYDNYTCDGTHITGAGGGTGLAVQVGMIVQEYDVDPVVGIDVVFRIACP